MVSIVARSCLDPVVEVREAALRCLKEIVDILQTHSVAMPDAPPVVGLFIYVEPILFWYFMFFVIGLLVTIEAGKFWRVR